MILNTNLTMDAVSLTEAAAIACYDWIGKGDEKQADDAAVTAMRKQFQILDLKGTIVIGEGERDEAPMLYIGEEVGKQTSKNIIDVAVDPLEGTTVCANAAPNSISVIAIAPQNTLLNAPDVYMDKIAIGSGLPHDLVDLDEKIAVNLKNLACAKKCEISELIVSVLVRPRHKELIAKIREAGARIQLIKDCDITASIATVHAENNVDMYVGIGGAPEGVLASAALKALDGFFQGRLIFDNESQIDRAKLLGIKNPKDKLNINDMVKEDVIFAATGVTDGWFLDGVKKLGNILYTNSYVSHSSLKKRIFIKSSTNI